MSKDGILTDTETTRINNKVITSTASPLYTCIVSSTSSPVYMSSTSVNPSIPIVTTDLSVAYNKLGERFNINTGAQTLPINNYLVTQITIPANWGKTMYVDRIRAGTSSSSIVDLLKAEITTNQTITPNNTNLGSSNTTSITAGFSITDTNPTTASPYLTFVLSGGTFETEFGGRFIISSKDTVQNYIIRIINAGIATAMTTFSWWEV